MQSRRCIGSRSKMLEMLRKVGKRLLVEQVKSVFVAGAAV